MPGNWISGALQGGNGKWMAALEKVGGVLEAPSMQFPWDPAATLLYIYLSENLFGSQPVHDFLFSYFICNGQKLETPALLVDE